MIAFSNEEPQQFHFLRIPPVSIGPCVQDVVAVDVDLDGDLDLVSANALCASPSR